MYSTLVMSLGCTGRKVTTETGPDSLSFERGRLHILLLHFVMLLGVAVLLGVTID